LIPFSLVCAGGFALGALVSRYRPHVWPGLASVIIGNLLGWGWYAAMRLSGYPGDAQDGIFIMMLAIVAGAGSYVGAYAYRLLSWLRQRSGRSQS
jgi:amino acid transporter